MTPSTVRAFAALHYQPARLGGSPMPGHLLAPIRDQAASWPAPDSVGQHSIQRLQEDWMGSTVQAWQQEGVLAADPDAGYYVYRQAQRVVGIFAELSVSADNGVWPCETADPRAVEQLLPQVRAFAYDVEPLWGLFWPGRLQATGREALTEALAALTAKAPGLSFEGPGDRRHELWHVSGPAADPLAAALASVDVVAVVVGAARAAALRAAARQGEVGALALLTPVEPLAGMEPPAIHPVHRLLLPVRGLNPERLVQQISRFFRVLPAPEGDAGADPADRARAALEALGRLHTEFNGFVLYTAGQFHLVRSKGRMLMENWTHPLGRAAWRAIDVNILHALVFERALGVPVADSRLNRPPVTVEPDLIRAIERVDRGEALAAFLVGAPALGQLAQAAVDQNPLPRDAYRLDTVLPAGLVLRRRRQAGPGPSGGPGSR